MELNELIDLFNSHYQNKMNDELLKCLWEAYNNHWMPSSTTLSDLIEKGFLKVSTKKDISRIEGYFTQNNIEKIKDKKEFIFQYLPNTKGLENGKRASYEDLLEFIQKKHPTAFDEFLTDFNNYTFGDIVQNNGYDLLLYVAKKVDFTFADSLEVWYGIKQGGVTFNVQQKQNSNVKKF